MGDINASDGSWKKMVIAKTNNEWISTIKTESTHEKMNTVNFSMDETHNFAFREIKKEDETAVNEQNNQGESVESMMQELDPLLFPSSMQRRRSFMKDETPEERATRLAKMSAYSARRLANETPEQRALRLKRMSEYAAKRLSQETSEQRAHRLARMSAYSAKRLASETPEQRQARLTRMSAYAARRLAKRKSTSSVPSSSNMNCTNIENSMPNQS